MMFTHAMFIKHGDTAFDVIDGVITVYENGKASAMSFEEFFIELPIRDIESLRTYCEQEGSNPVTLIINTHTREY